MTTLKYGNGKLLNIGRVILPTVKLVYDRDMEIANFIPKPYYEIEGNFKSANGTYKGKYINRIQRSNVPKIYNLCHIYIFLRQCQIACSYMDKY